MKKLSIVLWMVLLLVSGCSTPTTPKETTRTITDLAGNEVKIPFSKDIQKIVMIAPPLSTSYIAEVKDTSKLIAMNDMSFKQANQEVINQLVKNRSDINVDLISAGGHSSTINPEEVTALNPDLILIWGENQRKGLEHIDIPIVDFFTQTKDNAVYTLETARLMRDIFELKGESELVAEWGETQKIQTTVKDAVKTPVRALMIMNNSGEAIIVRAKGSHGDTWLTENGMENVAGSVEGGDTAVVSLEQIYEWNPDMIFIFMGPGAPAYYQNQIGAQDWSQLDAFKQQKIYSMPVGIINWGFPSSDAPLTSHWLMSKAYPELVSESDFEARFEAYYQSRYNITLTDGLKDAILNPKR